VSLAAAVVLLARPDSSRGQVGPTSRAPIAPDMGIVQAQMQQAEQQEVQMAPASSSESDPAAPKANVLLVDDTPANLLALVAVLEDLGHNLVKATSGEEALRLLRGQDFAVVLLDVRMPALDGFETAKRIRSREPSRHTPIIFLTSGGGDELPATEAYKLGAVDHLVKPLVPEVLRAKVAGFAELFAEKERAKRQADQLRLLIQATTDYAIFMLDPEGRVATWNAGAERIKGYRAEEIIGQHFSHFYPPEAIDRGWPAEELRKAAAEGRFEDEGWRVRKDGSRFWANVVLTALRDPAGRLQGFSKITRDLTERRRREEELRQLNRDLERRVRERTAALAASNQALRAENAERRRAEEGLRDAARHKDEFLAMLAHELRNPLAPVRNGLQILKAAGADREAVEQARAMMERQVVHMARIVDDLLDVSRLIRGQVELRQERLDLARLVRHAAADHHAAFADAGLTAEVDVPEVPLWVRGDPTRLTQVAVHLLRNAAKFTPRGGTVSVRLTPDAGRGQAVLAVRDTGAGIGPDLLPRLFEPFAQADRSLDRGPGGLGLGLALVKGLVELHGGEIHAASEGPGGGTEFVVRLPMQPEPVALTGMPEAPGHAPKRLRILVVEDNRDAADSLKILLELYGYDVTVAYTGPAGVERAKQWKPDAVLCDIGLPGLDGYGVVRELRQDPATAGARMIAVTGYGGDEDRRKSREAGFDAHLTKPADPTALHELLSRAGPAA
jgi:PAS domain S-box-containing protein